MSLREHYVKVRTTDPRNPDRLLQESVLATPVKGSRARIEAVPKLSDWVSKGDLVENVCRFWL